MHLIVSCTYMYLCHKCYPHPNRGVPPIFKREFQALRISVGELQKEKTNNSSCLSQQMTKIVNTVITNMTLTSLILPQRVIVTPQTHIKIMHSKLKADECELKGAEFKQTKRLKSVICYWTEVCCFHWKVQLWGQNVFKEIKPLHKIVHNLINKHAFRKKWCFCFFQFMPTWIIWISQWHV